MSQRIRLKHNTFVYAHFLLHKLAVICLFWIRNCVWVCCDSSIIVKISFIHTFKKTVLLITYLLICQEGCRLQNHAHVDYKKEEEKLKKFMSLMNRWYNVKHIILNAKIKWLRWRSGCHNDATNNKLSVKMAQLVECQVCIIAA